jgi:Tfp pilus assembly protein PilF
MLDNGQRKGHLRICSGKARRSLPMPSCVRVGEAQTRIAKPSDAAASFAAALAADPANVRARLGQVRLLAIERKMDEALAQAAKVVADNPKSADALVLQGELKVVSGDKAGARAA